MGIGKMFSDPNMLSKLAANPRTAKHLADASFMQKVLHSRSPLPTQCSQFSFMSAAPTRTAEPAACTKPTQQRSTYD
jgi:STI1 domain